MKKKNKKQHGSIIGWIRYGLMLACMGLARRISLTNFKGSEMMYFLERPDGEIMGGGRCSERFRVACSMSMIGGKAQVHAMPLSGEMGRELLMRLLGAEMDEDGQLKAEKAPMVN